VIDEWNKSLGNVLICGELSSEKMVNDWDERIVAEISSGGYVPEMR
jgi:hypothetical protein